MSGASSTGVPNRSPIRPSTSSTRWPVPASASATLAPIQTFTSPLVMPATTTRGDPASACVLEGEPQMAEQVCLAGPRVERRHRRQVPRRRQVRQQRRDSGVLDRGGVVDGVGTSIAPDRGRGRQAEGQQQPETQREPQVRRAEGVGDCAGSLVVSTSDWSRDGPATSPTTSPSTRTAATALAIAAAVSGSRSSTVTSTRIVPRTQSPWMERRSSATLRSVGIRSQDLVDHPPGVGELRQGRAQRVGVVGVGHARLLRGADRGRCGVRLRGKGDPGCDCAAGDQRGSTRQAVAGARAPPPRRARPSMSPRFAQTTGAQTPLKHLTVVWRQYSRADVTNPIAAAPPRCA